MLLAGRVRGADPEALERGRSLVDRLGLRPVADSLPHQLSGGEQQRFAIARALVNDPSLVLADEPTGNLDVEAGAGVLALLRELAGEGRAVVLVTHETTAAAIADRVLRLDDGRLRENLTRDCRAFRWRQVLAARRDLRRLARGRDGGDRRLRAVDGLRPRRARGRPAERDRALRSRGPAHGRRARARAAEPGGALVPARGEERRAPRQRARVAQGRAAHRGRRPARLRGRPRAATCAAPTRWWSSEGSRTSGGSRRATGCRCSAAGTCASSAWRSSPTTSRSRSRSRRGSTRRRRRGTTRSSVNLALLWLRRPRPGGHHAHAGPGHVVRDRQPRVHHARGHRGAARARRPGS